MAMVVAWYYEDRVILAQPDEEVTPQDVRSFSEAVRALLDASTAEQVHLLLDQTKLQRVSAAFREVRLVGSLFSHERFGSLLIYGDAPPLIKFVSSIATHATRVHRFSTMDEALRFLASTDPALKNLDLLCG